MIALLNVADAHHAAALGWYREALAAGEPMAAPWLRVAEIAAALSRGVGNAELAERAAAQVVADGQVILVAVDQRMASRASQLAIRHGLRGCDAGYAALAIERDEPLITFDRDQAVCAAASIGVVVPNGR